jgi:hypothetical protein
MMEKVPLAYILSDFLESPIFYQKEHITLWPLLSFRSGLKVVSAKFLKDLSSIDNH